jgi:hypothetical protein
VADSPYLALDPSYGSSSGHYHSIRSIFGNTAQNLAATSKEFFKPFRNASVVHLMNWFYRPSITKSVTELNVLVKDVIMDPSFSPEHFIGFDAAKENTLMDNYRESQQETADDPTPFSFDDKWLKGFVEIPLPCDGVKFSSEDDAPKFKVEFHYRKIIRVIQSALAEPRAEIFHTFPFKAYWKPSPGVPKERVYSEIYTGDFWNAEYEKICEIPRSGDYSHLEPYIVGLLLWSDSTSLAQFGNAELWPIYLYIGNQSKYERAKPNSLSSHHLAYLPKVDLLHNHLFNY